MGDYARKMKSKLGKKGGVVASAHRLARIVYTMIKEKKEYDPQITETNNEIWKAKKIKYFEKQILQLKKTG